jgi:tRNA pseudouridine synthase 10
VNFYDDVLGRAERILVKYPLCDACLGRLFARLGLGVSNAERGRALKTLLAMKLHVQYARGEISREYFERVAANAGSAVATTYKKLFNSELSARECYMCRNALTPQMYERLAEEAIKELEKLHVASFLVGVTLDKELAGRELQLLLECGLEYAESLKREIKREVGKIIRDKSGLKPDFVNPDAVVVISFNSEFTNYSVSVEVKPLLLYGRYWKLGRRMSQTPWYTLSGVKKYPLSVQESVESAVKSLFNASKVVIHAAGREDVDARMIGSGRPLVIEVKSPLKRSTSVEELREYVALHSRGPVKLAIEGPAPRRAVALLKELSKRASKVCRVCVYSPFEDISESELRRLEELFANATIHQMTPLRVIRRKRRERERVKRVYAVRAVKLTSRVFEALIHCEGWLYVKELVHGDQGRTNPSFASVLNKTLIPIELDVLYVEEKLYELLHRRSA